MYKKMNKLVRDNIPNIIEQKGDKPDFVILDSFDYYNELKKKLSEELTEFNESDDILELCDLVEVCLLYTSPSPRDYAASRMPSSA